jgi:hypothetical protein
LQQAALARDGSTWEVCIMQIQRGSGHFAARFIAADEADDWRVTPTNAAEVSRRARPSPAEFA